MPIIRDNGLSPLNRAVGDEEDIIDMLNSPLKKAEEKDIKDMNGEIEKRETSKEKLEKIFKNSKVAKYYEDDENGNLILGYEEKVVDGKVVKVPITQEKIDIFDGRNLLKIEVPLNMNRMNEKDELGLTPVERKRYEKLISMNRGASQRTREELIKKAKNPGDLDATIIPDVMEYFFTAKEDNIESLSISDKRNIKLMRSKGIMIEPETVSGLHKTMNLVAKDKTLYWTMYLRWLTLKGINLETLTTEKNKELFMEYKRTTRPSIELLIDASILRCKERVFNYVRENYEDIPAEDVNARLNFLANNPENYKRLIASLKAEQYEILDYDKFTEIETYFRVYGLNEDDSEQFNPGYISDIKTEITTRDKLKEFEEYTGNKFIDVYSYWWDIVSENKKAQDELAMMGDNPISQPEMEDIQKDNRATFSINEDISYEDDDDLDLI